MNKMLLNPKKQILFVVVVLLLSGGVLVQGGDEDYPFRSEAEYQSLGAKTAYEQYLEDKIQF